MPLVAGDRMQIGSSRTLWDPNSAQSRATALLSFHVLVNNVEQPSPTKKGLSERYEIARICFLCEVYKESYCADVGSRNCLFCRGDDWNEPAQSDNLYRPETAKLRARSLTPSLIYCFSVYFILGHTNSLRKGTSEQL